MRTINQIIRDKAESYIGITEVGQNQGWDDKIFEKKMVGLGWEKGWAYCAIAAELVWAEAYVEAGYSTIAKEITELMTPSAITSFKNFRDKSNFLVDEIPEVGSIIIWQKYKNGKKTWMGHVGVVLEVKGRLTVVTFEGNTNKQGSREGQGNLEKERYTGLFSKNGLNLLGYIHPKQVEVL